ncbi:MAG: phenylacetate--CoA ligase family protein, partial [Spirochaetes bacterium]|nr:phenylacetate--CoA ligase family protein [Spirochaetota bacterium]
TSWFTVDDYEREAKQTMRWTSEIKKGMLVLNRFPYSFAVPPFVLEIRCRSLGGVIVPAGYMSWNMTYPRTLEIIKRLKVEAIGCLPNEMIMLEMVADKCGYDLKKDLGSIKHVLTSGAIVPPALKEYIERKWGASVRSVYGSTETGGMASTCAYGNHHLHRNAFIFEILDPETKEPVKPGETGVLVVTSYYRKAAPLFRYYTRDICRFMTERCPCGDPIPTIEILGRMDDEIALSGKKVYSFNLEQSILEFTKQFDSAVYFVIVTDRRLHIRVETHNNKNKASDESITELSTKLGVPLKVHICPKGELLDAGFLLRSPEVYKPVSISDWRVESIRCTTPTEALIKWPHVGSQEFLDIIRRFFKNALQRRILK